MKHLARNMELIIFILVGIMILGLSGFIGLLAGIAVTSVAAIGFWGLFLILNREHGDRTEDNLRDK